MTTRSTITEPKVAPAKGGLPPELLDQYGCGPVRFTGAADALYEPERAAMSSQKSHLCRSEKSEVGTEVGSSSDWYRSQRLL